jgi:hypothetical protein
MPNKKKFSSYDLEDKLDYRLRLVTAEGGKSLDFSTIKKAPQVKIHTKVNSRTDVVQRLIEVIKSL